MKAHSIGLDEITPEQHPDHRRWTAPWSPARPGGTARYSFTARSTAPDPTSPPSSTRTRPTPSRCPPSATPIRPFSQGGAMFVDCLPTYTGTIDLIRRPDQGPRGGRRARTAQGRAAAPPRRGHNGADAGGSRGLPVHAGNGGSEIQLKAMAAGALAPEFPPEDVQASEGQAGIAGAVCRQLRLSRADAHPALNRTGVAPMMQQKQKGG